MKVILIYYGVILHILDLYDKIIRRLCEYMLKHRVCKNIHLTDRRMIFVANCLEWGANIWNEIENKYFYISNYKQYYLFF